jgi:FAD:protein FMN transferase
VPAMSAATSVATPAARDAMREGRALGSPLRLTVEPGVGSALVDEAWQAVVGVFAEVDAAMSRFRTDSEITRLHRARGPVLGVSRMLLAGLAAADRAGRLTDGRFDARVVTDLERLGFVGVPQAWADAIRSRGAASTAGEGTLAGGRWVRRDDRRGTIELLAPVDLGGIGKGLALRWAARRASAVLGGAGFLLDAGGDLVSRGLRMGERWSIGIEDPAGTPEPVAVAVLERDQAIATSSVRIGRGLDATGRPVHHLIDPATGEPGGAGLVAVTVAWPDPAWAEVWSKALFLEGLRGIATVARRRGLAAWWVSGEGEMSMTPAARQQTSWVREEAEARANGG